MIYYVQFQDGLDCKISVSQSSLKRVMVAHGDLRMEGTLDMLFLSDWQAFPHCQLMIHQEVRMDLCCKVFPLPMAMPNRENLTVPGPQGRRILNHQFHCGSC